MAPLDALAAELLDALARSLKERPQLLTELRALLLPPVAPETEAPLYLTVAAYAARLRLSKRTVENLIREGLPLVGRGRRRRVPVDAADAWMKNESGGAAIERRARDDARRATRNRTLIR